LATDIIITKLNNVYARVDCDRATSMELSERYTFEVPNARFMNVVKMKMWDGKIRLFNQKDRTIYMGLVASVIEYAKANGFSYSYDDEKPLDILDANFERFLWDEKPSKVPRDFQMTAFKMGIRNKRHIFISPTASGKSFMMYLTARYINKVFGKRVLVIVPSTQLVAQLAKEFTEYNNGKPLDIYQIRDGADKENDHDIVIATWQSIYNQKSGWYKSFSAVLGDEVHTFKADCLKNIMERSNTIFRLGYTGTLDGTETNELVLQGLFGAKHQVTTYAELRRRGIIADPKINVVVVKHPDAARRALANMPDKQTGKKRQATYAEEMTYLATCQERNNMIVDLVSTLKGNVLILYAKVDKHIKPMHKQLQERFGEERTHLIHGAIETDEREIIRAIVDNSRNAILSASFQTFQAGINIVNIDHIIFAASTASVIRLLQSIGRGLRRSEDKKTLDVWDFADDLRWKSKENHTFGHLLERINIYNREEFDYKLYHRNIR
jgi:superfamily II DNA or RNA helicase